MAVNAAFILIIVWTWANQGLIGVRIEVDSAKLRAVTSLSICGSLNPMIDIGQIEGGFVCGLGFNLLEDIVYDKDTGAVLNDGTWVSTLSFISD